MSSKESHNQRPAYLDAAVALKGNAGQWQAYQSVGNCVILAGPGSGKTTTITTKMARILHEDLRFPHGIACVTYSTECARELGRKLEMQLMRKRLGRLSRGGARHQNQNGKSHLPL